MEETLTVANSVEILNSISNMTNFTADNIERAILSIENVLAQLTEVNHSNLPHIRPLLETAIRLLEDSNCNSMRTGRPSVFIPQDTLEFLLSLDFKIPHIARMFNVTTRTIHNRMSTFGLSVLDTYTNITDAELDQQIDAVLLQHPQTGYKRMRGFLRARGIKVTVVRIRNSMQRIDPAGVEARRSSNRAINRREYYVQFSNEVWHIDTHHKLIRWGIVVHGSIDGKSCLITFLDAGNNNTATSNLQSFMTGVQRYGIPFRTRSDKGGENVLIAEFMIRNRGTGRASHICGRSVHNQRIERLWRDVFYGCLSAYKNIFTWLENEMHLDVDNPKHIAVLQLVFLPRINQSLKEFMDAWNSHPLSSEHHQTPLQLFFMNMPPQDRDQFLNSETELVGEEIGINNEEDAGTLLGSNIPIRVEDFQSYLTDLEMSRLQNVDFNRASNNLGADVFMEAVRIISNRS